MIEVCADVNQADANRVAPLHISADKGHEAVALALVEAGVDLEYAKNDDGRGEG